MMLVPVMSAGIRSGVNWMREKGKSNTRPNARTRHAFQQNVAPRHQRHQHMFHDRFLADDLFAGFRAHPRDGFGKSENVPFVHGSLPSPPVSEEKYSST